MVGNSSRNLPYLDLYPVTSVRRVRPLRGDVHGAVRVGGQTSQKQQGETGRAEDNAGPRAVLYQVGHIAPDPLENCHLNVKKLPKT